MTTRRPRLLLVSGLPPGEANVGELALREMTAGYSEGHIACLALVPPNYHHVPSADSVVAPIRLQTRPREQPRLLPGRWGGAVASALFRGRFLPALRIIEDIALSMARKNRPDKLWIVLDCVATIALASRLAQRLAVPLLTLVWDHPDHIMRQASIDRLSRGVLRRRFREALGRSERVAVVSERMHEEFAGDCGSRSILIRFPAVRHGFPGHHQWHTRARDEVVLAVAGTVHAQSAWSSLLAALAARSWRLGGRSVRIRVLGQEMRLRAVAPACVEFLGYRSEEERDAILEAADVLYLPVPFEESLSEVARCSFPAKLSTYIAARRPVFVHAPPYSAAADFARIHPIGTLCESLAPADLTAALETLVVDDVRRRSAVATLTELAEGEFSPRACRNAFAALAGCVAADVAAVSSAVRS